MSKYHINPDTGIPGVCRADNGKCPYGGEENHFSTYSEALVQSQSKLEEEYGFLPTTEEDRNENNATSERVAEIRKMTDPDVLQGVIEGLYDNPLTIEIKGNALMNRNLSREFIETQVYSDFQKNNHIHNRYLAKNRALTKEDISYMLDNTTDDELKLLLFMHPNLDKNTVYFYLDINAKGLRDFPYKGILSNPSFFEDERLKKLKGEMLLDGINIRFPENKAIERRYI